MRLRIAAILAFSFFVVSVDAQVGLRPDFFIEQTAPTNANFEVYSQKSGLPRRASLANLKKPLSPFITDTVDYIPAATGNLTDLASFVWDTTGLLWYIDGEGDAVSFDGGAGGGAVSDGDYSDITVSGTGTVWNIDAGVVGPTELANTAVTPASYTLTGLTVDADGRLTAASSGTIGSGTNGDMAVWSGANTLTSQTDAKFIYDNNLAYGQGTALRSAYWSNDTTLAPTLIEYSSTLYDADAITGAFGLPTGTTAERPTATLGRIRANSTLGDVEFGNGTLFRSVVESMANTFTPGELGYYNSAGVLTDTTIAAILSMGSGTTGSGVSGRVAYWNGTSSLTGHANFLWDGTDLSVGTTSSSYTLSVGTGGVYVTPQSAAVTGVEGAGYWDSDAPKGMWWHDGTAFRATVWGSAPSWTATYIPFSDGAKLVTEAAFSYNSGTDQLTVGEDIYAETFRTEGGAANEGLWLGSSATISILATGTGGTTNKFNLNVHSAGNEGYCTVQESGGTDIARFGNVPFTAGNVRGVFSQYFGGMVNGESVTYTAAPYVTTTAGGNVTIVGGSGAESANAGSVYIRGGQQLATSTFSGNTGNIFVQTYEDNDSTAATTLRTHMVFSSDLGSWPTTQLLQRRATTTGIQELTMESDTIKYRISNIGAISTSTDGSGDVTVTHSMGTTPTAVLVTPTGTTPWIVSVHTIGATTFKVRFYDAAGAAVTSMAVTATWLGKT